MEFCRDGRVIVNPLHIDNWIVSEFESSLVLLFTGVSRFSSDIIDEQTENLASQKSETIEAMMSLKREAFAMKEALRRGDLAGFGDCMRRSWASKKMTANRISTCEVDRYYDAALAHGARAGKVSGAGGGGFMAFLVDPGRRIEVIRALKAEGGEVIPCHFTTQGAEAWKISAR
jgi:D-glycero-alpha-D-manno-heptose-7-phosphate kinase